MEKSEFRKPIPVPEQMSMDHTVTTTMFQRTNGTVADENDDEHRLHQMVQMKCIKSANGKLVGDPLDDNHNQMATWYLVQRPNETLQSIAAHFDTTPAKIKLLNRMNSDHIFVGQHLLIPDSAIDAVDSTVSKTNL